MPFHSSRCRICYGIGTKQNTGYPIEPLETCGNTPQFVCALPTNAAKFSLVTSGNAHVNAKEIYRALAVGGTLTNNSTSTQQSSTATRDSPYPTSYIGNLATPLKFSFHGPLLTPESIYNGVDFNRYKELARRAISSPPVPLNQIAKRVFVVERTMTPPSGLPCWSTADFLGPNAQDSDSRNTLVIFRERGSEICLGLTPLGRKFGPTVIAPFDRVRLVDGNDFIDGGVVAREFVNVGAAAQLHGLVYDGPIQCA
jgi:hypothetical protein